MLPAQVLLWMATIVVVCGLASGSVGSYIYDEHTGNVTRARRLSCTTRGCNSASTDGSLQVVFGANMSQQSFDAAQP